MSRLPRLSSYLPKDAVYALEKAANAVQEHASHAPYEAPPPPPPPPAPPPTPVWKTLLAHGLGLGSGMAAGYGGSMLLNHLYKKTHGGQDIPIQHLHAVAPVISGAMGLAYSLAKEHEREELRRALLPNTDNPPRQPVHGGELQKHST